MSDHEPGERLWNVLVAAGICGMITIACACLAGALIGFSRVMH